MPLYRYICTECNLEFEELKKYEQRDDKTKCPDCGSVESKRVIPVSFGIKTILNPKKDTIYTPKEIDKVVGADADKKWQAYDERWKKRYEEQRAKRWQGNTPETINMPKDKDGKYSPIMHLGTQEDRQLRKDYSEALKEHRKEREKKGLKQFAGMKDRDSTVVLRKNKNK